MSGETRVLPVAAGEALATSPRPAATLAAHFGEAVWLLTQSPQHRDLTLADLEWLLMPPMLLGQHKLWRNVESGQPVGLALWAMASAEVGARIAGSEGLPRLTLAEWRSGQEFSLVTMVAPFGGRGEFLADIPSSTSPEAEQEVAP